MYIETGNRVEEDPGFNWYHGNPNWAGEASDRVKTWYGETQPFKLAPPRGEDEFPSYLDLAISGQQGRIPIMSKMFHYPFKGLQGIESVIDRWRRRNEQQQWNDGDPAVPGYIARDPGGRTYGEAMRDAGLHRNDIWRGY